MNKYKVNYLSSVSMIKNICVFYGPYKGDIDNLFATEPTNPMFEGIFNEEELTNIKNLNIPVTFSKQYLHEDDTIGVIKSKITHENENAFSVDEMYMFCMQELKLSASFIYRVLTQNNKIQLTKRRLSNFLANIVRTNEGKPFEFILPDNARVEGTDSYSYNDLLDLKLDGNTFWVNKPIGQKYFLQDGEYPLVCNPFELPTYDASIERILRQHVSTLNNNILLSSGNIVANNLYLCVAPDVLIYADRPIMLEIYYPLLFNKDIRSLETLEEKKYQLIEESKKKFNEQLFEQVDVYYDLHKMVSKNYKPVMQGITSIHAIVRQKYIMKIPIQVLFKIVNATKEYPYIKYNPGLKQEKLVRLYADKTTTSGKKIPVLSKAKIMNYMKHVLPKPKSFAVCIEAFNAHCEIDESGDISIKASFTEANSVDIINELIIKHINPFFENVKQYLQQHGYSIDIFENLYNENIDIKSIDYLSAIPIKKQVELNKIMGCVSSVFLVESDDIKKGIKMRFKRVSNFNKMTSMEAFIIEKQKEGIRDSDIISRLVENYDTLTREDAIDLLAKLASEMQIERGVRKNVIDVKSNPGFKTIITLNTITGELNIQMNNINDIHYLNLLPIYFDSLVELTQNSPKISLNDKKVQTICKGINEESNFEDIVAIEDQSYKEQQNIEEEGEDTDEVLEFDVGQKEKINDVLGMFFAEDEDEEEEEDDEEAEKEEEIGLASYSGGDGDDEQQDENNDDEGDDDNIKNITGMRLNNPDYFTKKIQDKDPILILTEQQGKYKAYSRSCHKNVGKIPVILTQKELDRVKKQHPGFLNEESDIIKYGSRPDNQYYYICPRYWDLEKNTIVTPKEIKEKGLEDKIIPMNASTVPEGKYIYEFNAANPEDYDPDRQYYPNLMVDKHPNGYCLPCCFKLWNTKGMKERKDRCKNAIISKKKDEPEQDKYILGPNRFPLDTNKWGYLPTSIQHMIGHKQITCVPDKLCLLRHGVEFSKNQSFIACLADAICFTKKNIYSIKEMKNVIISTLNLDNFIMYQNGSLIEEFYDKNKKINVNQPKYLDSKLYAKTRNDNNKNQFFMKVCVSFERFIEFLSDDTSTIDYTYLWDLVCTPHSALFENGLNLVILEVPSDDITDNVKIICPTNHYTSKQYDPSKPTLILYHEEDYYEPIYTYRMNSVQNKLFIGKFYRETYIDNVPEIKFLFETIIKPYYEKMCKPRISMPKVYKAKHAIILQTLVDICTEHRYAIGNQIISYQGKVIGLMIKPEPFKQFGFVPCFPSNVLEGYEYEFMMEPTIWNNYKQTIDLLMFVQKDTDGLVPCAPVFKVLEDEVIVGVLTESNQFVQLSQPEPVSNVNDHLREFRNNNFVMKPDGKNLISSDAILTSSNEVDEERVNYVKKIQMETRFYQAFRNTIRTMLNDPVYNKERTLIEKETSQMAVMYSTKLKSATIMLTKLVGNMVIFVKDYNYNLIKEIHTCAVITDEDKCRADAPLCSVNSNGKCQLILPKQNLVNGSDNERNYFLRMADELIRYHRVRQFMFEPQVYLSFGKVDYKINTDEIMIMQSLLNNEFFDNMVGAKVNKFASHTSYDNAPPQFTEPYSNEVKI